MNEIKIIAEIGINHDGVEHKAKKLIDLASQSGVNAVKFQYRNLINAYIGSSKEIGDEILSEEINRNFLSTDTICRLSNYAKSLNMEVGISFFDSHDISDFKGKIDIFDFFKVPSVELMNEPLINTLFALNKHIYISLGAHNEEEVDLALNRLPNDNWTPMHCISNYPTMMQNSKLGYISYLRKKWKRDIGYSSHDSSWEVCLLAMQLGVKVIERHITFDCLADGLDHSSSSTADHFKKLSQFSSSISALLTGNEPRSSNQGELINRQNLGRSFYSIKEIEEGNTIKIEDLVYRSPNIGIDKANINKYLSKPIKRNIKSGQVISKSVFYNDAPLREEVLDFALNNRISLPVRLHDLDSIETTFPIQNFEFHLSFKEVLSDINYKKINPLNRYSVHLPDYINPTQIIDPFSNDLEQRSLSLDLLNRTSAFAEKLQDITGHKVPIVGSFSIVHTDRDVFYNSYSSLLDSYLRRSIELNIQWLPPIAWYFGGSVELQVMNELVDVNFIRNNNINICMDVCHLILGRNYFNFSADSIMNDLKNNIKHIHIADAKGIDGEGIPIGKGDTENLNLIAQSLQYKCTKVLEVWQGHLDNGAGFKQELNKLYQIYDGK